MSSVPVVINGMIYPKDKTVAPYPATVAGYAYRSDVEVGGGPIIPPTELPPIDPPVEPPLTIWPPDRWVDVPEHPIELPDPPVPPIDPPATPTPPHQGWNWSVLKSGWYYIYVPGEGQAGPKA